MFAAGDLVVYGGEGVCRVESIGPSGMSYDSGDRMYYHLTPLYRSGTVLTPVDTAVLSQMDERYLKRAEEQLYGEMAAALDMAREEIVPFIRQTWPQWPERLPEAEAAAAE